MKFKNMLKTVVSTAIVMSIGATTLPLSVSAELSESAEPYASTKYYNSCDIDRNGKIEIMDVVLFNRCLVGADYISDYKQLDADTNGIINFADSYCISSCLVNASYTCSVDGLYGYYASQTISDTPSPISASKSAKYVKYNYSTEEITGEYTLSLPKAYTTENTASTYSVIGNDDRKYMTNQSEFSGIVQILLREKTVPNGPTNQVACSTGFIVGDHQIATAAHCVYGPCTQEKDEYHFYSSPTTSKNEIYLYDKDGNKTGEKLTPVEVHVPLSYIEKCPEAYDIKNTHHVVYCDYALITVEEDLSEYTHFSLGLIKDPYSSAFSDANIYVSGLPLKVNLNENTDWKIAKGCGKMYTGFKLYPNDVLYCTTDITDGDSGAPIYTITKYKAGNTEYYDYTAIGILSGGSDAGGFNFGVRMIPLIQRFYNSNPNFSY